MKTWYKYPADNKNYKGNQVQVAISDLITFFMISLSHIDTEALQTGVSDHHPLIFSFLKTSFTKMPPNKLRCQKYKSFDKIGFLKDVSNLPKKNELHRMIKSVSQSVE